VLFHLTLTSSFLRPHPARQDKVSGTYISCYPSKIDSTRRQQLIKQRAFARGMLSRIKMFIEAGDSKLNEIRVRLNKLPDIFNGYMSQSK
jgi:hypothetical protein